MRDLDLRLLRLFDAVYATRSTTRAAVALGLSQPTVSIGLGKLRSHYSDPLFVPTPDGMTATPFADSLVEPIRMMLGDLRRLDQLRATFDPTRSTRRFHIAMSDASHLTLLPRLFEAIRRQAPAATLQACPLDASLAERLADGDADIAVGLIPDLDTGFFQRVLYDQDWVSIMRAGRFDAPMTRDDYLRADHVEVTNGTGRALLRAALDAQDLPPRIALSLPGFLGLPSVLRSSDLIATLPRHIGGALARQADLAIVDCPIPIETFQVKLHWHARVHADPANAWLRETALGAIRSPT